jgi:hypothetical protein
MNLTTRLKSSLWLCAAAVALTACGAATADVLVAPSRTPSLRAEVPAARATATLLATAVLRTQATPAPAATETQAPAAVPIAAVQPTPHGAALSDVVGTPYRETFAYYTTMNRPSDDVTLELNDPPRQLDTIRDMYLSPDAIAARRAGQPLPVGSIVVMEVYRAQTDAAGQTLRDADGRFVRGELLAVETARNEQADNEVWSVGVFDPQTLRAKPFDVQKCLTCHDTAANGHPFIMTNRGLRTFVSSGNPAFGVCTRANRESC